VGRDMPLLLSGDPYARPHDGKVRLGSACVLAVHTGLTIADALVGLPAQASQWTLKTKNPAIGRVLYLVAQIGFGTNDPHHVKWCSNQLSLCALQLAANFTARARTLSKHSYCNKAD